MKYYFLLIFIGLYSANSFAQEYYHSELVQSIIQSEKIDSAKIDKNLYIEKKLPYNDSLTILVIPVVTNNYEVEGYSILDAYLYSVNHFTHKITHKYFKKAAWESDAVFLYEIEIDTGLYLLNDTTRAFGVRTLYRNNSQPNPYSTTQFQLFIPNKKTLQELCDIEVNRYSA